MIARTISIKGKVQGVFFRDWTVEKAHQLGVTGWVRNRLDGSVEAYAIGDAALIEQFVDLLREGSPASQVDCVCVEEAQVELIAGFTRRSTI